MSTVIDHLVIAAETLEQGAEYVLKMLGVDIPFGGVHPKMGTHNLLMQLGNTLFLEVIAINPDAAALAHPLRCSHWSDGCCGFITSPDRFRITAGSG